MKTVDNKELPAVTVIGEVLKYFKSEFFSCYEVFKQKNVNVPPIKKIKWILTVPAIWSLAAKQIMRNAAIEVCVFTKLLIKEISNIIPYSMNCLRWKSFVVIEFSCNLVENIHS